MNQSNALAPVNLVKARMGAMTLNLPEASRERFKSAAIGIASQPGIARCTPESVFKCVYASARLNLIPDPVLQHAAIIPFKNGKTGRSEATLIIMYRGMIELAKRACPGLKITAGTVYASDDYELEQGTEDRLRITRRWWEKGNKTSGPPAFYYATAKEPGGEPILSIIPFMEAEQIAGSSRAGNNPGSPWYDHPERMGEKTAVKRLMRFVSIDPDKPEARRLSEALSVDDRTDELPDDFGPSTMDEMVDEAETVEEPPTGRSRPAKPVESRSSHPAQAAGDDEAIENEDSGDALFGDGGEAPDDGPATPEDRKALGNAVDAKLAQFNMEMVTATRAAILSRSIGSNFKDKLATATRADVRGWVGSVKRMRQSGVEQAVNAQAGLG